MIRVSYDTLTKLLEGKEVEITHRSTGAFFKGESVPVELYDPTGVRVLLQSVTIAPRRRPIVRLGDSGPRRQRPAKQTETFVIRAVLDSSPPAMTLKAESGVGAAVTPIGENHDKDSPEAHGYVDRAEGRDTVEDAGETPDASDVASSAVAQEHARRFAAEKVDVLSRRRAKSMANRVRDALTQATAHGVDQEGAVHAIEAALEQLHASIRKAGVA